MNFDVLFARIVFEETFNVEDKWVIAWIDEQLASALEGAFVDIGENDRRFWAIISLKLVKIAHERGFAGDELLDG